MLNNSFKAEQMDPRHVLINAPDAVSLLIGAKGSLQITYYKHQKMKSTDGVAILGALLEYLPPNLNVSA